MVKLIAMDMDGTFLGKEGVLPEGAIDEIKKLSDKGIVFVVASGRSLDSIEAMFEPVKDIMGIIAENGSIIKLFGKELQLKTLPQQHLGDIEEFLTEEIGYPVIKTQYREYMLPYSHDHFSEISHLARKLVRVERIGEVVEPVVSVAINVVNGTMPQVKTELEKRWGEHMRIIQSGHFWVDMISLGTTKGDSLEVIMQKLDINKEETMAFGDYDNDIEMLELAKFSYAMCHANQHVKDVAKFECESEQILDIIKQHC
ncbi:MAG: hypothetical protein ATN35_05470 [Epulopiscium sp. Nele67-Bin004]|nr:MAG: hypothetical protein ATN35_05470 [Epulopiscium sp. Nele67-Bin004]